MSIPRAIILVALVGAGCSNQGMQPDQQAAPAAAPAPAAAAPEAKPAEAAPSGTLTLMEPADGQFSGHVNLFRWSAVSGADGYKIKISTGAGRVVWESAVIAETETHPPNTVALEPEPHTWVVTALKGTEVIATSPTFRFTITP
jgi:hypothetical protein